MLLRTLKMTETEKRALTAELEAVHQKTVNEIRLLTAGLSPHAQDCSLESLTKSELIGEANRMIDRLNELQTRQKKLEHALQHIDDEDFGLCESCGEPVPFERLKIIPETTRCIPCQNEED